MDLYVPLAYVCDSFIQQAQVITMSDHLEKIKQEVKQILSKSMDLDHNIQVCISLLADLVMWTKNSYADPSLISLKE